MRARPVALCVLLCALCARRADAQEDYHWENRDWNGLSGLYRAEMARGRLLVVDRDVDLAELSSDDALLILYPTEPLPVADLVAFVRDGGRLLVADDYGQAGPLIRELGLIRLQGPAPHREFLRLNEDLPVLRPTVPDSLLVGVGVVVANHPAVLTPAAAPAGSSAPRPVLTFDDANYGLLYEVVVGEGRAYVVADPSLFINFMREVADNGRLTDNLLAALCEGRESCQVSVLTAGRARLRGTYPGRLPDASSGPAEAASQRLQRRVGAVNEALQGLSELRPSRRGVYLAAVFLSLGVCVFLLSAIPLGRPRWLSFSLRLREGVRSRSEFEWNLERLLEGGRNDDFGLPLAILKDEFEAVFLGELAQHRSELSPERRYDPDQMRRFARRFAERVVPDGSRAERQAAASRTLSTLKTLSRIPSRNTLVPEVDGRYSERLLKRMYQDTRALLDDLGMLSAYERRAGRP